MQCAVNQCREINLVATLGSLRRNQWLVLPHHARFTPVTSKLPFA